MRNGLVQGVQAAIGAGDFISRQDITYISDVGPATKDGSSIEGATCSVAKAPAFVGLGVFSDEETMKANVAVGIAVGTPEGRFCTGEVKNQAALTAAVSSAFGPVGAVIAVIFGVIAAACDH